MIISREDIVFENIFLLSLQLHIRCGYTGHFLTWEITFIPRETAFRSVTDVSRGKFPVLNIHGYVRKITRSAHDI